MQDHTWMNKWEIEERRKHCTTWATKKEKKKKREDIKFFFLYVFWLSAYINYRKQIFHCVEKREKRKMKEARLYTWDKEEDKEKSIACFFL